MPQNVCASVRPVYLERVSRSLRRISQERFYLPDTIIGDLCSFALGALWLLDWAATHVRPEGERLYQARNYLAGLTNPGGYLIQGLISAEDQAGSSPELTALSDALAQNNKLSKAAYRMEKGQPYVGLARLFFQEILSGFVTISPSLDVDEKEGIFVSLLFGKAQWFGNQVDPQLVTFTSIMLEKYNDICSRLGVPLLRGIAFVENNRSAYAEISEGVLFLNVNKIREVLARENYEVSSWKFGDDLNNRPELVMEYFNSGEERAKVLFYHELGHHILSFLGTSNEKPQSFFDSSAEKEVKTLFGSLMKLIDGPVLSPSASTLPEKTYRVGHHEWFAESFALLMMERVDLIEAELQYYFRDLGFDL